MVVFSTGVMGAGKSFESVCRLYTYFGKDKKTKDYLKTKFVINKNIKYFRTNIPYNKDSFDYDENLDTSFNFNKFYEKIELLHIFYLDDSINEDTLKTKAIELGISNTLFLIDECQNYLDKSNNVLIFFFTYHRHFDCEIVLITQNLSLVHYKYKGFCEQFVRAVPSTFNLANTSFTYKYFPNSRMVAKQLYKTVKIKKLDIIYKSYISGGQVFTNNVIKKILIISFGFLFLLIIFTYMILKYYFVPVEPMTEIQEVSQKTEPNTENFIKNETFSELKTIQTPINSDNTLNNLTNNDLIQNNKLKLFKFNCFSKFCYYKLDNKTTVEIPSNILKTYLLNIDIDKKFTEIKNSRLVIYVLVNEDKFNFLEKGVRNDQENFNTMLPMANIVQ